MKTVILAGGLGTRLSEETHLKPKPMLEIGGRPILWHIMKIYNHFGLRDFVICLGYRGYIIKEYFVNYALHMSDVTISGRTGQLEFHNKRGEDWRVTLVDTGEQTMTGGRLKRVRHLLAEDDAFCMTYGDGLSNLNIKSLIAFHKTHGKMATVTAVPPPGRFGILHMNGDEKSLVAKFGEKTEAAFDSINGGFFVLSPACLDLISGDETPWEDDPMQALVNKNQLMAYHHDGFWQPMDTLREKHKLEALWASGAAPWKVWGDE
ncbi:glucose-1-phosphate cytidylyltransferase [Phyllobacterium leguminum]|uniref:Glucose-1-phosphate cytidylyltransferase n=1 Tax=Phyllobacterium leguminum TaxID=314237 RepID=A0A318SV19_9HYPH|nr:glucose-1-phosphate cytidylyltransferase [Phyllobacterium leguminum]PYE85245.1 glucose-1-phosphate cytidylyltransferase [Phyllobacterium leguminum]